MSIIAWLAFGLIVGFDGSKIPNRGSGVLLDIALGVVGAAAGGLLFHLSRTTGMTGFNAWSIFVPVIGAVVVLAAFHGLADGIA